MRASFLPSLGLSVLALSSSPAAAQDATTAGGVPLENATAEEAIRGSVFEGDYLLVGVGAVFAPSYEGSNDTKILPAGGVMGRVAGIDFSPRAAGVAFDFLPNPKGSTVNFNAGPVFRYRGNRTGNIKDPVVERLGTLDGVIEGGVAVGISLRKLINEFDMLSVGTDVRWDISGKGGGRVIAPGVSYFTPLSPGIAVGARAGAEFVDDTYARYSYSISPAGSLASGLPTFGGKGGFKEWNVGAFTAIDLNGNFLDGGLALGAGAQYSRLQGSAADTPITAIRGKRGQFFAGAGLAYTF